MVYAKITITQEKCHNPLECARCLRICQQAVLKMQPGKVYKFRETDGTEYLLTAPYYALCTGCNKCIEACPNSAISIEYIDLSRGVQGNDQELSPI